MRFLISLFMILGVLFAGNLETSKTVCEMAGNKSIEQIKKELLKKVKLAGVEELYGDNIFSQTSIENGKLLSDSIKSLAVGRIRVKGNPKYFNGKNLGEVCVSATLYVTEQDIKDFTPKKINLKNFCYANPDVPIKDIKTRAKEAAYLEIISQFSPSLAKKISPDQAADYIHGFKIKNANFDFNKGAYCFDAVATIIPYELKYQKPAAKTQNASETKGAVAANSSEFPEYFNNYIWEGKYKYGRIKAFYIDKNHTLFLIIFFENNSNIYTDIFKIKKNGLKISGKSIIYQKLYSGWNNWSDFSGIVLNNGVFKGVLNNGVSVLIFNKTNKKVKDYFTEVWKGSYNSKEFKNGKIYLMKNNEIKNYWADMYPTKNERGTDTYYIASKDGVISFYDIAGYAPIFGKDYTSFSFTGTMTDKNTFVGAGIRDFVTEIKLKRIK